jgi:aminoglycoside/choline kinase family phosphotransferase
MNHPSGITANAFLSPAHERLRAYLGRAGLDAEKIVALTPDASTREYFRLPWKRRATAVAAVYPEPFDPDIHPFLDVTQLFLAAHLPVPEILDVDAHNGIIVQEDLGDRQLRRVFETASEDERETQLEAAIGLIADIQAATNWPSSTTPSPVVSLSTRPNFSGNSTTFSNTISKAIAARL